MRPELAEFSGPLKRGDRILDKYEVRGLLGKGGHAYVYDCFNTFLAEEVAIKLIPNFEPHGSRRFKRARGEAQVLYRLNHPNVVRVMDGGEFNGMAYIVMEKLNGSSLRQVLRERGSLPVTEALLIALQIAEALEAAHAMNVIHRDLKPDNVFLLAENHVKVLDFGIAKFIQGEPTTQRDLIQGTAPYMSPEHAQGLGVTFASDIFQLGTMLYEMIAGVCPCMVGIEAVTLQELVAIQITKLPPRLKSLVRGVPDYVDRLVWRAIAKQAQQRFANMPAFTEALRNALVRLDVDLPRERLQRVSAVSRSSSHPPPQQGQTDSGVVKTVPLAKTASGPARHANPPPSSITAPMPAGTPTNIERSMASAHRRETTPGNDESSSVPTPVPAAGRSATVPRSPSATLIRAAAIGALAALPIGLVFGLARRASTVRPTDVTHTSYEARPSSAIAPARTQASQLTAGASPAAVHSARSVQSTAASSTVTMSASAKSPPRILAVRATTGLDRLAPQASALTTAPDAPGAAPGRAPRSSPKKAIF